MTSLVKHCLLCASALSILAAVPARAQDAAAEPAPPISLSGTVGLVSDYRFRGVSLSDEDVAVQGGFTVTSAPGFYVGTWGSSIESYRGAEAEVDVFVGWSGEFGGFKPDVGVLGYIYPGSENANYYEIYASVSGAFGPANAKIGANFAPHQDNLSDLVTYEDSSNVYVYGDVSAAVPNTPLSLKAHLGWEKGDYLVPNGDDKLDWLVGVDLSYAGLTLGVAYVDTDIQNNPFTDAKAVFSLSAAF